MTRLPIYLLVDSSEQMIGHPAHASTLKALIDGFVACLKEDPGCIETVCVALFSIDAQCRCLSDLTELWEFRPSPIVNSRDSVLNFGLACSEICAAIKKDTTRRDYPPLVIAMTAGAPSDAWTEKARALLQEIGRNDFFVCSFQTFYVLTEQACINTYGQAVPNVVDFCLGASAPIRDAVRGYFFSPPERRGC